MWFGTINGLTQYNPNNVQTTQHSTSRVWLDNVDLFYEQLGAQYHWAMPQPDSWNNLTTTPQISRTIKITSRLRSPGLI